MSITEKDIQNLTPEHRVVWKEPEAPREVELGLWVEDTSGCLCTDAGRFVRWGDGTVYTHILDRIVRIIEPALTPRRGLVIGEPGHPLRRLVRTRGVTGGRTWLGYAPGIDGYRHWFTDDEARDLIENRGWVVVDDLTKEVGND